MSNKLQAKDLINLGLFTVLYFVIGCCVAIPVGFVPIFLPILGALWSLITLVHRAGSDIYHDAVCARHYDRCLSDLIHFDQ